MLVYMSVAQSHGVSGLFHQHLGLLLPVPGVPPGRFEPEHGRRVGELDHRPPTWAHGSSLNSVPTSCENQSLGAWGP